jgi:hypothetical protein
MVGMSAGGDGGQDCPASSRQFPALLLCFVTVIFFSVFHPCFLPTCIRGSV